MKNEKTELSVERKIWLKGYRSGYEDARNQILLPELVLEIIEPYPEGEQEMNEDDNIEEKKHE